jgi:hypothetical protein
VIIRSFDLNCPLASNIIVDIVDEYVVIVHTIDQSGPSTNLQFLLQRYFLKAKI